ncbi:hypothetical protein ACQ4PT_064497 [Festuca glaucescens]
MASSNKPPFLIRFGAKRLTKFVNNELNDARRAVIATSCFADLARISKFHVPEELLEWAVMNIDPNLREYLHKLSKPIVFTRDMMTKVFNVPSGGRPVERLKNSEHTELRNMYRDDDKAPIAYLERLLHECADDDVVMIKRSFALLAFATVLFLGTNNMVPLDYLGSLLDMNTVDEYAWDEATLVFCMDQVSEFQEKRGLQKEFVKQNPTERAKRFSIGSCLPALVIVYIDHLDFPVELSMFIRDRCNTPYAINVATPAPQNVPFLQVQPAYQHPHVVQVHPAPQVPVVPQAQIAPHPPHVAPSYIAPHPPHVAPAQPVLQPSNVSPAQVPSEYNVVYEKHKKLFKREFITALSSFGVVVQGIQCNRMALLLKDVSDAARNASLQEGTNESNGISFDVPNLDPEACSHGSVSICGVGSSPTGATIIEDASVGIAAGFVTVIEGAVIANFATLIKQTKIIKLDIVSFARVNLSEYPQQKTNFDCGFFVILYMENFDGKIMKLFGPEYIPIFRKIVAATLFNSPPNEIDAAVAIATQAP